MRAETDLCDVVVDTDGDEVIERDGVRVFKECGSPCGEIARHKCVFCGIDVCQHHLRQLAISLVAPAHGDNVSLAEAPTGVCPGCAPDVSSVAEVAFADEWDVIVECVKAALTERALRTSDEADRFDPSSGAPIPQGQMSPAQRIEAMKDQLYRKKYP